VSRRLSAYLEMGVAMASDSGVAAWLFDADHWGRCGQGATGAEALADLGRRGLVVRERIVGDEQAFERDHRPATARERRLTLEILSRVRRETISLIATTPSAVLDYDDPRRVMPDFARWRTLRQMAWHVADTESRYYLPSLGLPYLERGTDLLTELAASHRHVLEVVAGMAPDLARAADGAVWTSVKLLRRLAWHERSELVVMRRLAASAR
jgi:hypothetical protein